MVRRRLGQTSITLTPIGLGAFKIGRNQSIRYPDRYDLPTDDDADRLLNGALDLGINYIDTAPAYGVSEQRIGRFIGHRNDEFIVSTKVGETFEDGRSNYDFSNHAVRASIQRSRERLRRDVLDIVFIHSDGRDEQILRETDVVDTLKSLRDDGLITAIGFSGKTVDGALSAMLWADALMVEYHLEDQSHERVLQQALDNNIGIVVKKGLASGHLSADEAIRFVLANPAVTSLIVGTANLDHLRANVAVAQMVTR